MTQDKARKAAARQRMAETGEPYSVARRSTDQAAASDSAVGPGPAAPPPELSGLSPEELYAREAAAAGASPDQVEADQARFWREERAERAQERADHAQRAAEQARLRADELEGDADEAEERANLAEEAADEAEGWAGPAELQRARHAADQARHAADRVRERAEAAQEAAERAQERADSAQEAADDAADQAAAHVEARSGGFRLSRPVIVAHGPDFGADPGFETAAAFADDPDIEAADFTPWEAGDEEDLPPWAARPGSRPLRMPRPPRPPRPPRMPRPPRPPRLPF